MQGVSARCSNYSLAVHPRSMLCNATMGAERGGGGWGSRPPVDKSALDVPQK